MGLDASVYWNASKFDDHPSRKYYELEEDTGGLYPKTDMPADQDLITWDELVAVEVYIGNSAGRGRLHHLVISELGEECALATEFLHATTDILKLERLPQIEQELDQLQSTGRPVDPAITTFVESMRLLVAVAKREQNPIYISG
jgi:hypothetical protein